MVTEADLLAEVAAGAEEPLDVLVFAPAKLSRIFRGDAQLFRIEQREQRPLDYLHPLLVVRAYRRSERLLGYDLGQDDGLFRVLHPLAQAEQGGLVGGENIATPRLEGRRRLFRSGQQHRGIRYLLRVEIRLETVHGGRAFEHAY